jgi:hypothetical protein
MTLLKNCALFALTLSLISSFTHAVADEQPEPAVTAGTAATIPETGSLPEQESPSQFAAAPARRIGSLDWHTDYTAAYRQGRDERKMLLLFFRDEASPRIADIYEQDVLAADELREALEKVVRVVLPLDAINPLCDPEAPPTKILNHSSFKYMYGQQGIAMIDLTDPESELNGHVVSAHAFSPGRHYTARAMKIVLDLPRGSVTQRALIYAVRLHPYPPISTTDGKCHGYMCQQAQQSSKLMAAYGSVGHHDWGTRYGEIAAATGRSAMEVAAMSANPRLINAALEVVDQWYGSPAHWQIMSTPAAIFGYDLVHDAAGNWWGTGVFAN